MSVSVYPPIPPEQRIQEEDAALARELEWLLESLQESLASLKTGLEECIALLAPVEPGSTLVVSTPRSDTIKGFVTRVGVRIVRGDMQLKLPGLAPQKGQSFYRLTLASDPLALDQLVTTRNLINQTLDVVDVSTWTGDPKNAYFIAGQLQLLYDLVQEAEQTLKGTNQHRQSWFENPVDERLFDPPLPASLSFHLSIVDAALLLELRTLEPANVPESSSISGFGFRERFAAALGGPRRPEHDEAHETFMYKGQEVRVRDKVKVESQDPNLMAAMAKLAALEHNVALSRKALAVVMGEDD